MTGGVGDDLEILRISADVEIAQNAVLRTRRSGRDSAALYAALDALRRAASGGTVMK